MTVYIVIVQTNVVWFNVNANFYIGHVAMGNCMHIKREEPIFKILNMLYSYSVQET